MRKKNNAIFNNKIFLVLNDYSWESHLRKGRYYISMGLSDYCIVLFIGSPPDRKDLKSFDLIRKITPKLIKIKKGLYHLEWPWWTLKIYSSKKIKDIMLGFRICLVKRIVDQLCKKGNCQIITYITHPSMLEYFNIYKNATKIYNPYDKFSEYGMAGGINRRIETIENKFVPHFDFVLCPHQQMVGYFKNLNRNTHLFPHGVDFEHYSRATKKETVIPKDILYIRKPIIGYAGVVNERIDFCLLKYVLERRPDWSIVMIGPIRLSNENKIIFDLLIKMANFYWLGYKRPDALPNYLKHFDVAIIPFKQKKWVKWISNPLKLHIYTSAGLPSVTSNFDNIDEFYDKIYIASHKSEWILKIQDALNEDEKKELKKRRLSLASENDWSKRINFLLKLVGHDVG